MSDQMNFFEAFGLGDDLLFDESESSKKETAKKKEAAKKPSDDGKKDQKKAQAPKDFDVQLPVSVKARGFAEEGFTVGTGTTAKASEVWNALAEKYPQFGIGEFELAYVKELKTVFVCDGRILATDDGAEAFPGVDDEEPGDAKITVTDGEISCELTPADFAEDGTEASEVTLGAVRDRFVAVNPSYKGCHLHLENGIAYPVIGNKPFNGKAGDAVDVIVNGTRQHAEAEAGTDLAVKLAGKVPGVTPILKTSEDGTSFLSYLTCKAAGSQVYSKTGSSGSSSAAKPKTAEKKYPLPMTLLVSNFNISYELSKDTFGGKEKVTKDEITAEMAKREPLFGDKDRKVEYLYNEGKNLMSCMFVSGTKG